MREIGQLFASFWNLFANLEVPLLGISFATLYTGAFVVVFSIMILKPILGIGQAVAHQNTIKIRRK